MITKSKALMRWYLNDIAAGRGAPPGIGPKWVLVSMHTDDEGPSRRLITPDNEQILRRAGMSDGLSLRFWDITDNQSELDSLTKNGHGDYILFNREMAKEVVDLVDRAIADPEPLTFVAQCDAGVSRSGAVATYAAERAGLDMREFEEMNSIRPNPMVLRLLHEVSGMTRPMTAEEVRQQWEEKERKANEAAFNLVEKYGMIFV